MITVYNCYYREKPRLPVLKGFQAIINLVSELWNTIEFPLRILYFTPNFTDILLYISFGPFLPLLEEKSDSHCALQGKDDLFKEKSEHT